MSNFILLSYECCLMLTLIHVTPFFACSKNSKFWRLEGSFDDAKNSHNNMCKSLLIHYMPCFIICGYLISLRILVLFFYCHFCTRMHNYDYKFCFITFVQKDLNLLIVMNASLS